MFDFRFRRWLTPVLVRFIYYVICILVFLGLIAGVAWFCIEKDFVAAGLTFVLGTLGGIFVIFLARVMLEHFLASVRTMQNTAVLVHQTWEQNGVYAAAKAPVNNMNPVNNINNVAAASQLSHASGAASMLNNANENHSRQQEPASPQKSRHAQAKTPGVYYYNGVAYYRVTVNTKEGLKQQWQPVG